MRLDDGETLELDVQPNEKVLVIWFFTKTITASLAVMLCIFMLTFFIDVFNFSSEIEVQNNQEDAISQNVEKPALESTNLNIKTEPPKDIAHPLSSVLENWAWATFIIFSSVFVIQVYFVYLRKTYRYVITNKRCIFIGGIIKRVERTVPYKKITDIQRSQNIVERMLGIWNVQVFTPGTASIQVGQTKARAELNFDGLVNSEELYEKINKHTQENS